MKSTKKKEDGEKTSNETSGSVIRPFKFMIILVTVIYRWSVALSSYSGFIIE
jgi:hypothetical protein